MALGKLSPSCEWPLAPGHEDWGPSGALNPEQEITPLHCWPHLMSPWARSQQGPTSPHRGPTSPHRGPTSPHRCPTSSHRGPTSPHRGPTSPHRGPTSPHRGPTSPPSPPWVSTAHVPRPFAAGPIAAVAGGPVAPMAAFLAGGTGRPSHQSPLGAWGPGPLRCPAAGGASLGSARPCCHRSVLSCWGRPQREAAAMEVPARARQRCPFPGRRDGSRTEQMGSARPLQHLDLFWVGPWTSPAQGWTQSWGRWSNKLDTDLGTGVPGVNHFSSHFHF